MDPVKKTESYVKKHKFFIFLLIIITLVSLYTFTLEGSISTLFMAEADSVISQIESFGIFGWFVFLLLIVLEVVLAPIPSIILYTAGGIVFGTVLGSILVFLGNIIGAAICYGLTKYFFREYVKNHVKKGMFDKFDTMTGKYGAYAIFLLRLNPFTSSDLVSYLAGVTNIKFRSFIIATGLGLVPLILVQTFIGSDILTANPALFMLFVVLSVVYVFGIFGFFIFNLIKR